jgi:hypothetical protein
MKKEKVLEDSKNYLISVHDSLRRSFRSYSPEEQVFINEVLEGIEKDVKQLEVLEEMMELQKSKKDKKVEMIEEEKE